MDLHKVGVKFFAADPARFDILKLIPMYHRWIQQGLVGDVGINVADYSHVPAGPGVMLTGALPERFAEVARKALKAAELMSTADELEGALQVPGNRLQFFANDRLLAPNTDAAYAELEPALRTFLDRLYAGAAYTLTREADPKERLSVRVQADGEVTLTTLLERLN